MDYNGTSNVSPVRASSVTDKLFYKTEYKTSKLPFALRSLHKLFNIIRGMASPYFSTYIYLYIYIYIYIYRERERERERRL